MKELIKLEKFLASKKTTKFHEIPRSSTNNYEVDFGENHEAMKIPESQLKGWNGSKAPALPTQLYK